ncbi:hypothetical protein IB267_18095 [Ensifer sp. ENS09]|uniref:hypothetical protein n=1 Tax=Ensifer sp. ENS09 TaxID=2769263 RepID=UPI001786377D|nr:hypothetical protein [Ensifer sp. ENS09]MBD9650261.1 hypothetical protein [Ensifer sp. ENS09]
MTDKQTVQFYAAIRKDTETLARLGQATSEAELVELILDEAKTLGFEPTVELVKAGLDNLPAIIEETSKGDELSEMELEIVSGGLGFSAFLFYNDRDRPSTPACKK